MRISCHTLSQKRIGLADERYVDLTWIIQDWPCSPDLTWIDNIWSWADKELIAVRGDILLAASPIARLKEDVGTVRRRVPKTVLGNCVNGMMSTMHAV